LAHETRPGYLEIKETARDEFAVVWKVPALGDLRLGLYARLPESCRVKGAPARGIEGSVYLERWTAVCDGGLTGKAIGVDGLRSTMTDALVRIEYSDGATEVARLKPDAPGFVAAGRQSTLDLATTYLRLGVDHILSGIDHLLFVLGLVLLVKNRWMLLKTITAFTCAHSITLAVATLGYATVPVPPLNAAIALSILFLGPEIVRSWRGGTSLTIRHPWMVSFAFGLLHGFGFASGLAQMGLPQRDIPLALLSFNVGVELGQLGFVALVLLLERSFRVLEIRWPRWAEAMPAYAVGGLGAFWTIDRVAAIFAGGA
jgi:hydrogenase/urease accessory protein HupE